MSINEDFFEKYQSDLGAPFLKDFLKKKKLVKRATPRTISEAIADYVLANCSECQETLKLLVQAKTKKIRKTKKKTDS